MDYICRLIWSVYLILYYYLINLLNYFLRFLETFLFEKYICYLLVLSYRRRQS